MCESERFSGIAHFLVQRDAGVFAPALHANEGLGDAHLGALAARIIRVAFVVSQVGDVFLEIFQRELLARPVARIRRGVCLPERKLGSWV